MRKEEYQHEVVYIAEPRKPTFQQVQTPNVLTCKYGFFEKGLVACCKAAWKFSVYVEKSKERAGIRSLTGVMLGRKREHITVIRSGRFNVFQ